MEPLPRPSLGMGYRYGSHRGPNPPAFCQSCGRPMVVRRRKDGHDIATGEQLYVPIARCTARWWQFGLHDKAEQDKYGDWPWTL